MVLGLSNGPIRFAKNGSSRWTNAAIVSVLKSRSAMDRRCASGFSWNDSGATDGEIEQMKLGVWFYGVGTIFTGILDIVWGDFDGSHQPIQSLGKNLPGQHMLAYVAGVWLVAAGLALLWRRSEKVGAAASGIAYLIFAALWLFRYAAAIH